jgi:hypothetical protein
MLGVALGRKNYIFAGSDVVGERAAAMYTIVQTTKLHDMSRTPIYATRLPGWAPINRMEEDALVLQLSFTRYALTTAMAISLAGQCACAASGPVPQEVAVHIEAMDRSCRDDGGTPMAPKGMFPISGQLKGDGYTDWAIDEGACNCDGAWSIFSGWGGALVYVFAGTSSTSARESFVHGSYGMRLQHSNGRDILWLKVGGQLCGQSGHPSHSQAVPCERPLIWDNSAQAFNFGPLSMIRGLRQPKSR